MTASMENKVNVANVELVGANIVILAKAHNPSILSPDWLARYCEVSEAADKFVHTPDFSLFDSPSFQIVMDQARMQTIAKKLDKSSLEATSLLVRKYVETLPHIPYVSIGLNYVWRWQGPAEDRPKIWILIDSNPLPDQLDEYRLECGGILYGYTDGHRMKTQIEVISENRISFNFNLHFEVEKLANEDLRAIMASFVEHSKACRNVLSHILSEGVQK
jgi:hypothetical protein